jgi:beta-phosphoglucomutase-like phosphatase (HAD superfamily)/tRNA(Arg) A34 adenosine deaminase TadA
MALDALLFDLDGTLFDTNATHVEAWYRALQSQGYRIGRDRIRIEIGKGRDKLVPAILGQEANQQDGETLCERQSAEFRQLAKVHGIKPFPGALELLAAVRLRQLQVVLATSIREQNLRVLTEVSGVDLAAVCDLVVTADDTQENLPAPGLVATAVHKLGMSPAQCGLVGDTLYDMQAAKQAGVIGLGVCTGFESRHALFQGGARVVFADVAAVLAQLDEALRRLSPATVRLTNSVLEELMRAALAEARQGYASGEVPIGCVIADGSGQIVARGFNQYGRSLDRTAHAEMIAFRNAAGKISEEKKDFILVSTLEPCVMCTGAAMEAAIDTIVYGLRAPADSGTARVQQPESPESQVPRVVGGVLAAESRALFERFAGGAAHANQRAFAEQLLALTRPVCC